MDVRRWLFGTKSSRPTSCRVRLSVEGCEERTVPTAVIFAGTSVLTGTYGDVEVGLTVVDDSDNPEEPYLWTYTVKNLSYYPAGDFGDDDPYHTGNEPYAWFAPATTSDAVVLSAGTETEWEAELAPEYTWTSIAQYQSVAYLAVGESAEFWLRTAPVTIVDTVAVYADSVVTQLPSAGTATATGTVKGPGDEGTGVSVRAVDDAWEAGPVPGAFEVTRLGGDLSQSLTVSLDIDGSATNGTDYDAVPTTVTFAPYSTSALVVVTPKADNAVEGGETVSVTVLPGSGYVPSGYTSAEIGIDDDPPIVEIISDGREVTEGGSLGIVFGRTGGDTTQALTIAVQIGSAAGDDPALPATDFTVSGAPSGSNGLYQVTFAAGAATASITVNAIEDGIDEETEWGAAEIVDGTGYTAVPVRAIEFALAEVAPPPRPLKQVLQQRIKDMRRLLADLEQRVTFADGRTAQQQALVNDLKAKHTTAKDNLLTATNKFTAAKTAFDAVVASGEPIGTEKYKKAQAAYTQADTRFTWQLAQESLYKDLIEGAKNRYDDLLAKSISLSQQYFAVSSELFDLVFLEANTP